MRCLREHADNALDRVLACQAFGCGTLRRQRSVVTVETDLAVGNDLHPGVGHSHRCEHVRTELYRSAGAGDQHHMRRATRFTVSGAFDLRPDLVHDRLAIDGAAIDSAAIVDNIVGRRGK